MVSKLRLSCTELLREVKILWHSPSNEWKLQICSNWMKPQRINLTKIVLKWDIYFCFTTLAQVFHSSADCVFSLVWSTFSHLTVTLWHLILYIIGVSAKNVYSCYCEVLFPAKKSLTPWEACIWIFHCCCICNYTLLSGTLGIDYVGTWLSSSIPVTCSRGREPILAEIRSVLTGDCNVAGSDDAPWCSPWPNSWEESAADGTEFFPQGSVSQWQLVMQGASETECRGSKHCSFALLICVLTRIFLENQNLSINKWTWRYWTLFLWI